MSLRIEFSVSINAQSALGMEGKLCQILDVLNPSDKFRIEISESKGEQNEKQ